MIFCFSREQAIDFEPLLDAILSHWKRGNNIDPKSIVLSEMNKIQGDSEAGFTYLY